MFLELSDDDGPVFVRGDMVDVVEVRSDGKTVVGRVFYEPNFGVVVNEGVDEIGAKLGSGFVRLRDDFGPKLVRASVVFSLWVGGGNTIIAFNNNTKGGANESPAEIIALIRAALAAEQSA